ncbi:MAG TPA: VanZ family protein [Steroidobacteraceae bacterium]
MNLRRVWWALGVVLLVLAMVVCLVPVPSVPAPFEWSDKTSHLVGHGTLALYFAGLVPRRSWWKIFAWLLLMGVTLELAQHYMQLGREGDPRDAVANAAGAALGLLIARLGGARWPELAAWLLGRRAAQ